jgi:hypothetical protein
VSACSTLWQWLRSRQRATPNKRTAVHIRDAIAHGRLVTIKELPFRLWKFGPRKDGHVDIEFSEELTADWLKSTSAMIVREKQKVLDCFAARGYQGPH